MLSFAEKKMWFEEVEAQVSKIESGGKDTFKFRLNICGWYSTVGPLYCWKTVTVSPSYARKNIGDWAKGNSEDVKLRCIVLWDTVFPNSEQQIRWHAQGFQILNAKFIDRHNVSRVATQNPLTDSRFQILNTKSADRRDVSRQVALVVSPFKPPPSC